MKVDESRPQSGKEMTGWPYPFSMDLAFSMNLGKMHALRLDVPYSPLYRPTLGNMPSCLLVEIDIPRCK